MAGNIIPAIATTNAIIAGLVVLHAFYILENKLKECRSVYLRLKMNHRNQLLVPEKNVNPPNPKCYVCAPMPQAVLVADTSKMTIKELDELVLKNRLNMIAPDVMIDGKGTVVISSEEGETEENNSKILEELGIKDGTILKVDDFHQNYSLTVTITHRERSSVKDESPEFLILANEEDLMPKEENDSEKPSTSNGEADVSSEDAIMIVETEITTAVHTDVVKKRKTDTVESDVMPKKQKLDINNGYDVSILEDTINNTDNSSEKKTLNSTKCKSSSDDDCLIVYDESTETIS